jgi:hypothetical protein
MGGAYSTTTPVEGEEAALFCKKARKKRLIIWDMGVVAAKAHARD